MARPVRIWARSLRCLASSTGVLIVASAAEHPVEAHAGLDDGVLDRVRVRLREPLAGVRAERVAQHVGDVDDAGDDLRVVEDPPQRRRPS